MLVDIVLDGADHDIDQHCCTDTLAGGISALQQKLDMISQLMTSNTPRKDPIEYVKDTVYGACFIVEAPHPALEEINTEFNVSYFIGVLFMVEKQRHGVQIGARCLVRHRHTPGPVGKSLTSLSLLPPLPPSSIPVGCPRPPKT